MRDTAIGGIATLLNRGDWRDSEAGQRLVDQVSAAMSDPSGVVRMRAAGAIWAVHAGADASVRTAAIGELLLTENEETVRAVLVEALASDLVEASGEVDSILERLLDSENSAPSWSGGVGESERGIVTLLTYLALVAQTPFASRTVEVWCREAPAYPAEVSTFAQDARRYLSPSGNEGQAEAFRLLSSAANASLDRWTRDPSEHLAGAELSQGQLAELKGAAKVAHEVAQQLYFASGASNDTQDSEQSHVTVSAANERFASLGFPVLAVCAGLGTPQCLHYVVQTLVFLAPLNEGRALQAIAAAVRREGSYAGDSLAGAAVIPYLERLLAEQRQLVLFNEAGVTAFRQLLESFAVAGNESALALAYTFAEVFR